jgi:F-type H+-transporting ATPase subunit alpha
MPAKRNLKTQSRSAPSTSRRSPGHVTSFYSGIGIVTGLSGVFLHQVLTDAAHLPVGVVIGYDRDTAEVLFFDEDFDLEQSLFASGQPFSVPVSASVIGRVVDGLGNPLDHLAAVPGDLTPVFQPAPAIIDREPVSIPLTTGIKIIDTNLPLGRGQRQLIIGDRKLGKSTLAIDTVLNQKPAQPPVVCIYVLCGQKHQKLQNLVSLFQSRHALLYTTVVAATANSSFAQQYLAPFVGCTLAEYFRDRGQDALVIYDDLSKHANVYRDISLLLERAPGREAYPGDIFSLHAGLLERAAKLSAARGGGSLTALPIIETQEGDITSFIPTNLISITDGQIYLERGLFQKGYLPAVNVGLSVSRVGSQAQPPVLKQVVGGIRLALAQHKELQKLSQLETVVSQEAQKKIQRGDLMLELLKQPEHTQISWPAQAIVFFAVEEGFFDDIKKDQWSKFESLLIELIVNRYPHILSQISQGQFNQSIKKSIQGIVSDFKQEFVS